MADQNKSSDLMWVFKDIWQTGTQELSKNVGSMLSSTPPNQTAWWVVPKWWSWNQITTAQEKWEKEVIERRKG